MGKMQLDQRIIDYCQAKDFLKAAEIIPIKQDCSPKQHYRLVTRQNGSFILMDTYVDPKIATSLVEMNTFLLSHGLSAPKIFDFDQTNSLVLLEDFGDRSYNLILRENPEKELSLYKLAVEVLAHIVKINPPIAIPRYDNVGLNLGLQNAFLSLYIEHEKRAEAAENLTLIFDSLYKNFQQKPQFLLLRDYHVDNMMFLEKRNGLQRLGLLDIQDAAVGYLAYDLVSLLEDARRDIKQQTVEDVFAYFCELLSISNVADFTYMYNVLGMQRSLRVKWIFTRFGRQRSYYKECLPRVNQYITKKLHNDVFEDLNRWFVKYNIPLYE